MDLKTAEKTLHRRKLQFARGELTAKQFKEFAEQTLESLSESFEVHATLIKMVSEEHSYLRHAGITRQDYSFEIKPAMTFRQFEVFLEAKEKEGKKWTTTYGADSSKNSEASICKRSLPLGIHRLFCARNAIVPLDQDSVFVDLGSGYGLVVAQIALTTAVGQAVGVEYSDSHALIAREVSDAIEFELNTIEDVERPGVALIHDNLINPLFKRTRKRLRAGTVFYITNKLMQEAEDPKLGYASTVEVKIRNKLAELILQILDETDKIRTRILVATDPLLDGPEVEGTVGSFSFDEKWPLNCRLKQKVPFRPKELKEWNEKHETVQYAWVYEFGTQIENESEVGTPTPQRTRPKRGRAEDSSSSSSASSSATMISAKMSKQREPEVSERELFDEGNFAEDESMWRKSIRRQLFQQSLKQDIELIYMNTLLYKVNHFMWTQRLLQLMDIAQSFARPENESPQLLALMPSQIPPELRNEGTDMTKTWELTRGGDTGRLFDARTIVLNDLRFSFLETPHRSHVLIIENLSDMKAFFEMVKLENLIQKLATQRFLILLDLEEVTKEKLADSEDPYNMAVWAEEFDISARDQTQKYRYDTRYVILRSKKLVKEVKQKTDEIERLQRLLDRPNNQGEFAAPAIEQKMETLRAALTTKYQKE